MGADSVDVESDVTPFGRKVGERVRGIRRQKGMSLQEVEVSSRQEFKASVLGAYERGERAISVSRLERLARLYNVPIDQMLPLEPSRGAVAEGAGYVGPVTIDLQKLSDYSGSEARSLQRFVRMIQLERQDFNGRMLTVRSSDLVAIAAILDTPHDHAARRLEELGLRLKVGQE